MKSANENLGGGIGCGRAELAVRGVALLARTGADQADEHQPIPAPQVPVARATKIFDIVDVDDVGRQLDRVWREPCVERASSWRPGIR